MGKVKIKIRTTPDGKVSYTILGHSEGSTCHNTDAEALINRLVKQNVPGYGGGGEELDSGKTQEFYESKPQKTVAPLPQTQKGPKNQFDETEPEQEQQSRRVIDTGFGT